MRFELTISTKKKHEMIDITERVQYAVAKSGVKNGICNVFCMHATGAIIINENYDPNVCDDVLNALNKMVPEGIWKHDKVDGNGAAHIKAAILGPSETVPVKDGKLELGKWQSIMFVELDGPRSHREIVVNTIKGD